jgi:hypothetical protein
MTKEELFKYVDTELQALRYYALEKTRMELNIDKPIYEQLVSIGYTKRVLPLPARCAHCRVTANEPITKDTPIESIEFSGSPRNSENNIYTGLEFWLIKYPEDKQFVLNYLQSE